MLQMFDWRGHDYYPLKIYYLTNVLASLPIYVLKVAKGQIFR